MTWAHHILVATDLSENSEIAFHKGAEVAAATGARVTLLNCYDTTPMVPPLGYPSGATMSAAIEAEVGVTITNTLIKKSKAHFRNGSMVEVKALVASNPALGIAAYAKSHAVDLIVVGTHGRTGVGHLLLGSVAERIVRHAPCSVLVARTH